MKRPPRHYADSATRLWAVATYYPRASESFYLVAAMIENGWRLQMRAKVGEHTGMTVDHAAIPGVELQIDTVDLPSTTPRYERRIRRVLLFVDGRDPELVDFSRAHRIIVGEVES